MSQYIEVQTYYPPPKRYKNKWVMIGKESVGKTTFIDNLMGRQSSRSNLQGSSLTCIEYQWSGRVIMDTPGIQTRLDSVITTQVIQQLQFNKHVILTLKASSIKRDIVDLWPMLKGQSGIIVITHWDKVKHKNTVQDEVKRLKKSCPIRLVTVENHHINSMVQQEIDCALEHPQPFPEEPPSLIADWHITPKTQFFELAMIGPAISLFLLVWPAWFAVTQANTFADWLYPFIEYPISTISLSLNTLPPVLSAVLVGDYGLISMIPFLILYALPTVFIFSILMALYKSSGLIDRLAFQLDPIMQKLGLSGRDLVRVIMGFGCNVPAIIQTRQCSCCTRGSCISAISFGSACSYQLPATVAVFGAAGKAYLTMPYLLILGVTTCLYLILTTSPRQRRMTRAQNLLSRGFIQAPNLKGVTKDISHVIKEFMTTALPLFVVICVIASLLAFLGVFNGLVALISPLMQLLNLPNEAAIAVILGSIRKDGLAIALLDSSSAGLKLPEISDIQLLCTVYLAGVMLPCIVSLLTVIREMKWRFATRLAFRQMVFAMGFTSVISWGALLTV